MSDRLIPYAGANDGTGTIRKAPKQQPVEHSKGGGSIARYTGRMFTREQIAAHQRDLTGQHFAILMASLGGDYRHISDGLGIPIGTAKSRLSRARVALTKIIGQERIELLTPKQVGVA